MAHRAYVYDPSILVATTYVHHKPDIAARVYNTTRAPPRVQLVAALGCCGEPVFFRLRPFAAAMGLKLCIWLWLGFFFCEHGMVYAFYGWHQVCSTYISAAKSMWFIFFSVCRLFDFARVCCLFVWSQWCFLF